MLHSKMKKISSYVCLVTLFLTLLVPAVSSHIYAETVANENDTITEITDAKIITGETTITEETVIAHSVVEIPSDYLFVDESIISIEGTDGLTRKTYTLRYENEVEVSRVLIGEEVVTKPVDTIKYVGTKSRQVLTLAGTYSDKLTSYSRYIDVTATAYDLSFESCGKRPGDRGYGITASGMQARVGVVAVDPRVIPLGTRLYIEAVDGSWVYGMAIAGDTGGSIKGNRVDLFFNTKSECMSFGRRTARVYILD